VRSARPRTGGGLADRLLEGRAPWRDAHAWLPVRGWVSDSIEVAGDEGRELLVAEDDAGVVVGFVSLGSRVHPTGQVDTYMGELVVARDAEGSGLGASRIEAAERCAVARGCRTITLETGARNQRARRVYAAAGFQ